LIILSFIALGCYCQQVTVSFSASATSSKSDFRGRSSTAATLNISLAVGELIKSSELTLIPGQANFDALRFVSYAINPILGIGGVAPTSVGAYYSNNATFSNNTDNNGYNFDVSASLNYQAIRFFSLEEVDVNGNIVNTIRLNSVSWSVVSSNVGSGQTTNTFVIGGSSNNINIQITFVTTSSYGTLSVSGYTSGPVLSPKGMEIIFSADLTSYVYASSSNSLRLVTYTVTGAANRQTNVTSTVSSIPKRVYSYISSTFNGYTSGIRFDGSASYKGNQVTINANMTVSTSISSIFGDAAIATQINTIFGANAQLTRVNIAFPAGAQGLVTYDPAVYFGCDTYTTSANSGATLLISSFIVLLLLIFTF